MSLASRITNNFSSPPSTQRLAAAEDGLSGGEGFVEGIRRDTMAQKAVEEESRPPYIHVSWYTYSGWRHKLI